MRTWELVAGLPIHVEGYGLEPHAIPLRDSARRTTVIRLEGGGHAGVGEDVSYDADAQLAFQRAGAHQPLAGATTLAGFSELLDGLELWPDPAKSEMPTPDYRRWAYESAALDLALRQAGRSLGEALDRDPRPVTFVVSPGLGDPPSVEPLRRRLELYPELRFKLDPGSEWTDELVHELAATGTVEILDYKAFYTDQNPAPPDLALYRRVVEGFPGAWLEDPALTEETEEVFRPHRDRITWDAPIHSVADVESLAFPPRTLNVKPSRFGFLRELLDFYDYCTAHEIGLYGGGMFELGPGRGQIQHLASLFNPDGPNDVAPGAYNEREPRAGLPSSPLTAASNEPGFR
jgi:L-alanine-DL-glutamate epimerase-like enolase superfamily enzyme